MTDNIKLTAKQIKFCEHYIKGNSGKDSYSYAYDCNGSDQMMYNEASKLLARDDIQEYLKTLRKPLEENARSQVISEREKKRSVLWAIVEAPDSTYGDKCRALDLLNKMDQEYINITKNIDKQPLDGLDIDTLKSLVQPSQDS